MSWLKTICSTQDDADRYFDIGHGDFHEEFGLEPDYVVWALIGGRIETGNTIHVDADGRHSGVGGTHGILWGHNITDLTYKGRYEPETGRLSIVSPSGRENQLIPSSVLDLLKEKFSFISEVHEF